MFLVLPRIRSLLLVPRSPLSALRPPHSSPRSPLSARPPRSPLVVPARRPRPRSHQHSLEPRPFGCLIICHSVPQYRVIVGDQGFPVISPWFAPLVDSAPIRSNGGKCAVAPLFCNGALRGGRPAPNGSLLVSTFTYPNVLGHTWI